MENDINQNEEEKRTGKKGRLIINIVAVIVAVAVLVFLGLKFYNAFKKQAPGSIDGHISYGRSHILNKLTVCDFEIVTEVITPESKKGKPEFISTLYISSSQDNLPVHIKVESLSGEGRQPEDAEKEREAQKVLLESHLIDRYLGENPETFQLGQSKVVEEGDYVVALTDLKTGGDTAFLYFYRKDTHEIVYLDEIDIDDYVFATTKLEVKKFVIKEN